MKKRPIPLFAIIFGATVLQIANGVLVVIIPFQLGLAKTSARELDSSSPPTFASRKAFRLAYRI